MSFFNNNILTIRDKMNYLVPSISTDISSNTGHLEIAVKPYIHIYLDCFSPVDLIEVTSMITSSKPST